MNENRFGNQSPRWMGRAERDKNVIRPEQWPGGPGAPGDGKDDGVMPLVDLLWDEREEVRVIAAYSLAESGKAEAVEAVLGAAARGRLGKGPELVLVLSIMAESFPGLVRKLLGHGDTTIRRIAVSALTNSGRREAGVYLLALLRDEVPDIRAAAARGLGQLRYGQAGEELRRALLEDESWEVKTGAAWALRELRMNRCLAGWGGRETRRGPRK